MPPLPDDRLRELLATPEPESARCERRSTWSQAVSDKAREAVCAFANDLSGSGEPGYLIVGVSDDGTPSGLAITDELLLNLADIRTDGNILPVPSLSVERRVVDGAAIAVVTVRPSDFPPVKYKGRIWVRSGPRRQLASAQDERILNERRRHRDKPFDLRPLPSTSLADLSLPRFTEEYLPKAYAADVLAANERSLEERLAATRMILGVGDPTPTVLGILTLGLRAPAHVYGAYVQFLRVDGTSLAAPIVGELIADGPLLAQVERIESAFASYNRKAVEFSATPRERVQYLYPPDAFAQLFRNALMHRNYETSNAPVRVDWYNDRIEIGNPGGPFGDVTVGNFGEPGVNDYRNPNLAAVMRDLQLVQRFGAGIARARRALRENGSPELAFEVSAEGVRAVLWARGEFGMWG